MADTHDSKGQGGEFANDPDKQSPPTPAETDEAKVFMTDEEVEPHADKGHYDVVSDIKMGHANIPKFLKVVYASLAAWGLYYALSAAPINDRTEASPNVNPTAQVGQEVFSASCAGCHNATAERKIGPGLLGAAQRLGDEGLTAVLHNGRPEKGMPAPPTLGLNDSQIQSLKLYIESLK